MFIQELKEIIENMMHYTLLIIMLGLSCGEASVKLYENSLILRLSMTEFPFVHDKAFKDAKK